MGLTDQIKSTPKWIWVGGGVVFLLLIFLATSRSGSSQTQTVGTPATDVNDILNQLQDAADLIGGQTPPTTGNPPTGGGGTTPPPATSIWGADIPAAWKKLVTEAQIKAIFSKNQLTFGPTIDKSDLDALFKKLRLDYGGTINTEDVKYLVQQSNNGVTSIWGRDIAIPSRLAISEKEIKSLFAKNKISYGTVINQVDLQALFKKLRIPYGTTVDKGDLAYLAKKY